MLTVIAHRNRYICPYITHVRRKAHNAAIPGLIGPTSTPRAAVPNGMPLRELTPRAAGEIRPASAYVTSAGLRLTL
jgi:hypothetical protein